MTSTEKVVAEVLQAYEESAKKHNLYDWDDLEAVEALEKEFHKLAFFHPIQLQRHGD